MLNLCSHRDKFIFRKKIVLWPASPESPARRCEAPSTIGVPSSGRGLRAVSESEQKPHATSPSPRQRHELIRVAGHLGELPRPPLLLRLLDPLLR